MAGQVSSFVESIGTGESGMQGHVDCEFIKSFGSKLVRHPPVATIVRNFPAPGFHRVRAGDEKIGKSCERLAPSVLI